MEFDSVKSYKFMELHSVNYEKRAFRPHQKGV
jgi:hypothetical protein